MYRTTSPSDVESNFGLGGLSPFSYFFPTSVFPSPCLLSRLLVALALTAAIGIASQVLVFASVDSVKLLLAVTVLLNVTF